MVLSCQAGIGQISFDVRPVAQAVVVEYFQIVGNDEGYIVIPKAFTKHNQPSYTPVSVLEGVDGFEALMFRAATVMPRHFRRARQKRLISALRAEPMLPKV